MQQEKLDWNSRKGRSKTHECAENANYNASNQEYKIVVSRKEAYHQFGNSVALPVIKRLAKEIVAQLLNE